MTYAPGVRAAWLTTLLIACHPSATIESKQPVANLQSYGSVALRVHTNAFAAQGQAMLLEASVLDQLRQKCSFSQVGSASQGQQVGADVVLDLNVTGVNRGGGGMIANPNSATMETLLVLSDGRAGDLLGTVKIKGKSSGVLINNGSPEKEAIDVIAKTIAELLAKSGCSGPRVARVDPPPGPGPIPGTGSQVAVTDPPPGPGSAAVPPPNEGNRAQAEAFNEQGKEKLYSADLNGALALFQQANQALPDAKYEFNICLTLGAQEQWANAQAACQQARGMNPTAALQAKIDHRLELLAKHQ